MIVRGGISLGGWFVIGLVVAWFAGYFGVPMTPGHIADLICAAFGWPFVIFGGNFHAVFP